MNERRSPEGVAELGPLGVVGKRPVKTYGMVNSWQGLGPTRQNTSLEE